MILFLSLPDGKDNPYHRHHRSDGGSQQLSPPYHGWVGTNSQHVRQEGARQDDHSNHNQENSKTFRRQVNLLIKNI